MKFIQNLSIRNKLLLIVFLPLAASVYFLFMAIQGEMGKRRNLIRVHDDVMKIEKISDVISNIQEERGYSINFVASQGKTDRTELFNSRTQTDRSIAVLRQLLAKQQISTPFAFLDTLSRIRNGINGYQSNIDSLAISMAELGWQLADAVNITYRGAQDQEIRNMLESHLFLLHSQAYLGQVRMRVHLATVAGGFKPGEFAEFALVKGKFESNIERYYKISGAELAEAYTRKMNNPAIMQARLLMDSVFSNPAFAVNMNTDIWRVNMTTWLHALKEMQDASIISTQQLSSQKLAAINRSLIISAIILVIVVVIITWLLVYTIRSIANSISLIKDAADRIAGGDLNLDVPVKSKDEIGALAASFNKMIGVSREYVVIADTIAKGNYTPVVNVRSEADKLGKALANMKENLLQLSKENETRTWLLTGTSELNDIMRGEKEVHELAQDIINKLSAYLNAQVGAVYVAENGHLDLTGSYAFHQRKGNKNQVKKGEGLVGQAALEKKPIIFGDIPDDYIQVNSGLGSAKPKNILVYPFLYDGNVRGVIELGTVREFSDTDMQLLEVVSTNIGIAFNSARSRAKLKELLQETQRQAEELQAQQEELRQINEELQEKTDLLERSEAELKAQQEELQQTNEELEEKANLLEEQKEKLEVAKQDVESKARELEATSKYKSEFLANMSHELRTPLNSILILAQLLSENRNKALTEKDVEYARNIYNSGTDLLNLINEILDLSKVEAGKIEIEINSVPVEELTDHINQLFKEIAAKKHIDFDIRCSREQFTAPMQTDKQRLEQILRNLLSNAFKFTEKGGKVSLDISVQKPGGHIRNQQLRQLKSLAVFTVSDNGIGIPADKQELIFEAFQQADGSTKRKYGGTGLGLSISRELAGALGGEIHLRSEEARGSTFTLYLPLVFDTANIQPISKEIEVRKPTEKPVRIEKKPVDIALQAETADDRYKIGDNDKVILIIEDDVTFANILLDMARMKGYKGVIDHQGNTGLSLARYYRPDAIILDMKLPVLDGSEVLRQLKNDPELRHIPVQIMSGFDRRKEGLELGAFDFVRKPLDNETVQQAFDRMQDFINRKLKKLLVVEDNQQQNKAIRELIGNGDVKSFAAYTGEEAFSMLQQEKFDCIIIDLGLPDMSGFELLEKIKVNDQLNKIPVIVYTGKDMNKDEARRLEKLANTVVLKTSDSKERLLDETALFLHRVESRLPKEKQQIIRKLHRTEEILRGKKVLIVDDDMRNTYSLSNVLDEEGMKCFTAENGRVAIEVLQKQQDIDIVLMDIMMPEMDGFEATQAIRQMNSFNKLPIIALTAKAMKGDREKCLEAGMSDYIAKPVNMDQLLSLMRVWLYR
jgi:CheY-like chemotaxis protein/HAMP domain-containing protein